MALPLSYSIRNIFRRPARTFLTILGISVVIFACVLILGVSYGIKSRFGITGDAKNMIYISKKGQNVIFSKVTEEEIVNLSEIPGVATNEFDELIISPELMCVPYVTIGKLYNPIKVRGVTDSAYQAHRKFKLVDGELPFGSNEVVVGVAAHRKLRIPAELLKNGSTFTFDEEEWTVVGHFSSGGDLYESEIWTSVRDLMTSSHRTTYSFVTVRFNSVADLEGASKLFSQTGVIEKHFKGWPEKSYYDEYAKSLDWIFSISILMVICIVISGVLIGSNTMYTAIVNRTRELATLRMFGFKGFSIYMALQIEALIIALVAGLVGSLPGFFLNTLTISVMQGSFYIKVDWFVISFGVALAAIIGILGTLYPAIKGLKITIIEGLTKR